MLMRKMRNWATLLALMASAQGQGGPAPEARARQAVEWVVAGQYEKLIEAGDEAMKKGAPLEVWQKQIGPLLAGCGKLQHWGEPQTSKMGPNTVVVQPVEFEKAALDFTVAVAADGRLAGFFLRPAAPKAPYSPAPYAHPDRYTEREVSVGDDPWKLGGTLAMPRGVDPAPAVVLVHGSGAHDRVETINPQMKPFRDLSDGLASRGIAVLRYEKRTKVYGAQFAALRHFTVQDETVDDAVRAVKLLAATPGIDPRRIYVLGHSLGGYLLPRILEQAPQAAGGIALAGSTRPLEDLLVEQLEYLIPLQTAGASDEIKKLGAEHLARARQAAAEIKALTPATLDGPPIENAPRSYWLDLKGYNPPALAAKLHKRLLVLQGERDYQVTMADFANWNNALAGQPTATLKSYPALNHLFEAGTGKARPEEYTRPGHIAAEIIDDIAAWVLREPPVKIQ
jgi:dienelactone hydrolase